jgi:peptidoglycan/LPS O-acetylase OafA/YrhL
MANKLYSKSANQIKFIDGLRGLAALYVMIGHCRWLLWEGYESFLSHKSNYSYLSKALVYFLATFKYGHEAVMFFFVLSGFVIHYKYSVKLSEDAFLSFEYFNYIGRRIKRLVPPLLFAILLTCLLDNIGLYLNFPIYTHTTAYSLINQSIGNSLDITTVISTIFFLQNVWKPVYGSNAPLWSLMYEWWFYMLYPLLFWVNKRSSWLSLGVSAILVFIGSRLSFVPLLSPVLQMLFCWWLGVLLADVYTQRIKIPVHIPYLLMLLLPLLLLFPTHFPNAVKMDVWWSIVFFSALFIMLYLQQKGTNFILLNKLQWLGECSFSLYVTHFPIVVFMCGALLKYNNGALPSQQYYIFIAILITLMFAWLIHFIIEKPFVAKAQKIKTVMKNVRIDKA